MKNTAVFGLLMLVAGCTSSSPPQWLTDTGLPAGSCNPLDSDWDCLYPFPSNFYLVADKSMPSGARVTIPVSALPTTNINRNTPADAPQPIDFLKTHPADGFAVNPQLGVLVPGGVDTTTPGFISNLTPFDQLGGSQQLSSPILIVDAETGALIPQFAEMDPRPDASDRRALIIRPIIRMQNGHRYVVAMRNLKHLDGSAVTPPDGFRRIRDQVSDGTSPLLLRATSYYNAHIFPVLEKIGVTRSDLVLAWDLTTESAQNTMGDMLDLRTDLMAKLDAAPPSVTITQVEVDPEGSTGPTALRIHGKFAVPNYMQSDDNGMLSPGTLLNRDADGKVAQNGTWTANLLAIVPRSVVNGTMHARIVQYGHGFFGSVQEISTGYPPSFADQTGTVLVATDWLGMSIADVTLVFADAASDPSNMFWFVDRVHQGMADFIGLNYAARHTLADATFANAQGQVTYPFHAGGTASGAALFDASQLYYYGISQGCILGSTYLSLAPAIERGVCGVGGASFGMMMSRASPFAPFLAQIDAGLDASSDFAAAYPDQAAQIHHDSQGGSVRVELLSQTTLDTIDPITWLVHEVSNPLPGAVAKKVAYQIGVGDAEVPNIATHLLMRSLGLPQLSPAAREIFGIPDAMAPIDGSAMTEWDFRAAGIMPPDLTAQPSQDNPVHGSVREQPTAIQQIDAFFHDNGTIQQFCPPPMACQGTPSGG